MRQISTLLLIALFTPFSSLSAQENNEDSWQNKSKTEYSMTDSSVSTAEYSWDEDMGIWETYRKIDTVTDLENKVIAIKHYDRDANDATKWQIDNEKRWNYTGMVLSSEIEKNSSYKTVIEYNEKGFITKETVYEYDNGNYQDIYYNWQHTYTEDGKPLESHFIQYAPNWESKNQYTYTNDSVYTLIESQLDATSKLSPQAKIEYVASANGDTVITKYQMNAETANWDIELRTQLFYNNNGMLVLQLKEKLNNSDSTWYSTEKTENEYDTENRLISSITYEWETDSWIGDEKQLYAFDLHGNMILDVEYRWDGDDWKGYIKTEKEFNGNSQLLKLTKYSSQSWIAATKEWIPITSNEYQYDEKGRQTTEIWYRWPSGSKELKLHSKKTKTFDDENGISHNINYDIDTDYENWIVNTESYTRTINEYEGSVLKSVTVQTRTSLETGTPIVHDQVTISKENGCIIIANTDAYYANLYNVQGIKVLSFHASNDTLFADPEGLPPHFYLICVFDKTGTIVYTEKIYL